MIKGSCLCGEVKFQVNGKILLMSNCHCPECRKAYGSAFGTLAFCKKSEFSYISGENHISSYKLSDALTRHFCNVCGSQLPVMSHEAFGPYFMGIPAGLLDDDPQIKPSKHLFVSLKAPWWDITDAIPQYQEWHPGFTPSWEK